MSASKQLVFIPEINPRTWLLLTRRENGTCLRDYSSLPPTERRDLTSGDIETMLRKEGSYAERLPSFSKIPYHDGAFWQEQIEFRNIENRLAEKPKLESSRLLEKFTKEVGSALNAGNSKRLRVIFDTWKQRFESVKDKAQFNHWDNDASFAKVSPTTGIGWTSQLLEYSRERRRTRYVATADVPETSFSLLAMELSLGISKNQRSFRPDKIDYIKPDGLGIRKNGYLTILEVKGPKDDPSLDAPMLQATCGALAVFAKRTMLSRIARKDSTLRSGCIANVPKQKRSLGVHVLTAAKNGGPRSPWTRDIEDRCKTVLDAFHELSYIAYSFVNEEEAKELTSLVTDVHVTPEHTDFSRRFNKFRRNGV